MRPIIAILFTLLLANAAAAQGVTFGSPGQPKGQPTQHPYPAEPQYQYPFTDGRAQARPKCPKGHALFQGRCRIVRRVD